MLDLISSFFNYDTIVSSFISAIGYGIGYSLPDLFGLHPIICVVISMLVGLPFDYLAEKLLSNKQFTGTLKRKRAFAFVVYVTYFIAWYFVNKFLIYDLDDDFFINILLILVFQTVAFIIYHIKRYLRKKARERKNGK